MITRFGRWWIGVALALLVVASTTAWHSPAHVSPSDGDRQERSKAEPAEHDVAGLARYEANLSMLRAAEVRNSNHDDSAFSDTPSADLAIDDHVGPRSDYLTAPGHNGETSWPVAAGGQFRITCEFSHFSYDDPLVYPSLPGAAHLHMHFGNTDVNAFSTYDSLLNSGSSTCNGQELNRTGYWVPAMFDQSGSVRVPDRITVYYKGENLTRDRAEVYPPGAAMIASTDINTIPVDQGGTAPYKFTFQCTSSFRALPRTPAANTIPTCDGNTHDRTAIEHNVRFPTCWNGQDPANPENYRLPGVGNWYQSNCEAAGDVNLPNMEYIISYHVRPGETTNGWYLSSDVDPGSGQVSQPAGSTSHGDWWGAWHRETNEMWLNNCVKYANPNGAASGCGNGYLSDGGPDRLNPTDGLALKMRPQYSGPITVSALQLHNELCPSPTQPVTEPSNAAYCAPGSGHNSLPAATQQAEPETSFSQAPSTTLISNEKQAGQPIIVHVVGSGDADTWQLIARLQSLGYTIHITTSNAPSDIEIRRDTPPSPGTTVTESGSGVGSTLVNR